MCRRRWPTSAISRKRPGFGLTRPSKKASTASSSGIASTIAFEDSDGQAGARAEEKTSDVRPPRHADRLLRSRGRRQRQEPVEELHRKPDRQKNESAHLGHRPVNDERKKRHDPRPRPQDQKCA